jgi:hypothetical protein
VAGGELVLARATDKSTSGSSGLPELGILAHPHLVAVQRLCASIVGKCYLCMFVVIRGWCSVSGLWDRTVCRPIDVRRRPALHREEAWRRRVSDEERRGKIEFGA